MSRDAQELREKAEAGSLSEAERAYLAQREGVTRVSAARQAAEEHEDVQLFEAEGAPTGDNYQSKTVEELEDELSARNLPRTGNKGDLIARLRADDEG